MFNWPSHLGGQQADFPAQQHHNQDFGCQADSAASSRMRDTQANKIKQLQAESAALDIQIEAVKAGRQRDKEQHQLNMAYLEPLTAELWAQTQQWKKKVEPFELAAE